MKKSLFFMIVTLLLLPSIVIAQALATTCPDIVNTAIQAADELCEGLERNSICYGNFKLDATPQDGVDNFYFERVGDIAPVNDLARLEMSPMKEDAGEWGVAVMALQANLPNTLPGQNVTFILFGDVTLENATTQEQVENGEFSPMQAFYLTTGIGESNCAEAPESGMLVQTPKGVGEVNFVVNGVEIAMGSTVFFQASADTQLTATTVEGSAVLTVDEKSSTVLAGTRFGVSLLEEEFLSTPNFPESYQDDVQRLAVLPLNLLEREINIHPPFDGAMLEMLRERIENEQPLCGEAPFPPCNELPAILGGETCVFPENYENNLVPLEIATRPICETSIFFDGIRPPNNEVIPPINPPVDNRTCIMRPGPESPPLPANETR
ncbi:MAG TPA: hypothetical protein PLZ51_22535, partial [Aggregatilineales bacterium]|nr:hypothetical protein [Aggregatilineales bacterium]